MPTKKDSKSRRKQTDRIFSKAQCFINSFIKKLLLINQMVWQVYSKIEIAMEVLTI